MFCEFQLPVGTLITILNPKENSFSNFSNFIVPVQKKLSLYTFNTVDDKNINIQKPKKSTDTNGNKVQMSVFLSM